MDRSLYPATKTSTQARVCRVPTCAEPNPQFYKNRRQCKACMAAYKRSLHEKNPERRPMVRAAWGKNNKDKLYLSTRTWKLKHKYGITLEDYTRMLDTQGGVCKICKKQENKRFRNLAVDHCHKTGKVRGLLCHGCNKAIGIFKDDPGLLRSAALYLEANNG